MDIDSLKIFVEVMRRGSFAAVARDRNLDPSSISRSIRSLEDELGIRLFQRSTRALTPTHSGVVYFQKIGPLVDEIEKSNIIIKDAAQPPSGLMRVTTSVAFGRYCVIPKLPAFLKAYPELTVDLVLSDDQLDLINQRIDVALRLGLLPDSSFIAHKLQDVSYSVVVSPQYLREHPAELNHPQELTKRECVLLPYSGYRDRWKFRKHGGDIFDVSVHGRIFISSAIGVLQGALSGMGPALIADWLSEEDVRKGNLVRLFPEYQVAATSFETAVWFMYTSRDYLPMKVRVFLDFLHREMGRPGTMAGAEIMRVA